MKGSWFDRPDNQSPDGGETFKDKVAAQLGEAIKGLNRVPALARRLKALEEALSELMHQILRFEGSSQKITAPVTAEQLLRLLYNWALNVPVIINEDNDQ